MTQPDITYSMEDHGRYGRLVARVAGFEGEGMVRWSMADEATIIAEFAGVPKAWEGTRVAARMVAHFVELARDKQLKVIPHCGYVAAQFKRHPEWADLRA